MGRLLVPRQETYSFHLENHLFSSLKDINIVISIETVIKFEDFTIIVRA